MRLEMKDLKSATKIVLLILMRVFSKLAYQLLFLLETSRCALVANALRCKIAFSAIQKLKLFSLLKIKEGLKSATKMALPVFNASFLQKLAYLLPFFISLQNGFFSNSRI